MAHDLRTPLQVARGYLELLDSEAVETVKIGEALDDASRIVDDMLTYARNEGQVSTQAISLERAALTAWRQIPTRGATLEVLADQQFEADIDALDRILVNLFKNAIDHGTSQSTTVQSDGGVTSASMGTTPGQAAAEALDGAQPASDLTVTVGTFEDGFFVADDGFGFDDSLTESVFTAGVTTHPDGTGIGLAIVEQFVTAHGWSIWTAESAEGGARFEISGVDS